MLRLGRGPCMVRECSQLGNRTREPLTSREFVDTIDVRGFVRPIDACQPIGVARPETLGNARWALVVLYGLWRCGGTPTTACR